MRWRSSTNDKVSREDKLTLARDLGHITRRLHGIIPVHSTVFEPSWNGYDAFFRQHRSRCVEIHREWGTLPEHLIAQLDSFLLSTEALYDPSSPPHLIHADITRNHILGRWEDSHWTTRALIDWGDVGIGTLEYELAALHLDLFACDKGLLAVYLDAYGMDEQSRQGLPRRAMSTALLHAWDTMARVFGSFPQARQVATLEELTSLVWEIGAPGLNLT